MMRLYSTILLTILLMLALAACQTATQTTAPTETITNAATPTQAAAQPTEAPQADLTQEAEAPSGGELAATAYPGGEVNIIPTEGPTPASGVGGDYPAPEGEGQGEGPGAMPAVENRSLVTARLVEQAVDEANAEYSRLTVEVLNSTPFDSMPEFTSDLVGQSVEFLVLTTDLPQLNPGDTFEAEVTFRGDEFGGEFFASELMKAP